MEKGRIACMAWSVTLLALICGLAPAAEAAIPANNVHAWGASGTTLNTVIYGTPVRGASPVSTTAPGGGGTLNSYLSGTTPISKLSVLKAFDGGTPISMSESPRSTTVWAAVENATTGAHELWYWNSTNPNPVKHAWTPAAGEEILKIVSSVEGSSSGYGAHAMLTTTGSSTNVYTWGSNTSGRTGQGTTSGSTTNPTAVAALSGTTIVDIAAGFNFMLAADSTGAIWGWGNNANGQLARSDIIGAIATPGKLIDSNTVGGTAPSGVVQVVAAGYAGIARTASDIYTWGNNNTAYPIGRTTNVTTPTRLSLASCVPVEVTAGSIYTTLYTSSAYGRHHAAARCSNGSVYGWGSNYYGEAGVGSTSDFVSTPALVTGISLDVGETLLDLDAGSGATFALTSAGRVFAWGSNYYRQLGITTTWNSSSAQRKLYNTAQLADRITSITVDSDSRIHAEGWSAAILDSSNVIWTWGYAGWGLTGRGTRGPVVNTTGARFDRIGVADGVGLARVESTGHGTVALMTDGSMWTWGEVDNANWSNGDGTAIDRLWPGKIDLPGTMGLAGATVTVHDLSCSVTHCLMSTSDGKVYGWGDGTYRQVLPSATTTIYNAPTEITTTTNPAQVAAGYNYSLLVDTGAAGAGGTVKAWGQNTRFQAHPSTAATGTNCALGTGTTCLFTAMQDVTAAGTNVIDISAAQYHSLALRADGEVKAWGDNSLFQLGTGSNTQLSPSTGDGRIASITLPTGEATMSLHTGLYHSLIRTATGKLVGWGTNDYGVLGNGTNTAVSAPAYTATTITGTSPLISVDTFGVLTTSTTKYANQTVAVDATGQVWAWGSNVFGQVGANITAAKSGTNSYRNTPQRVQVSTTGNLAISGTSAIAVAAVGWNAAYTPLTTGSAPSAPTIGAATRGDASATVTWTAPSSPRSLRAFTIVARTSVSGAIVARAGTGSTATSGTITGLTNGTPYYFSVYATNEYGDSAESGQATATPATTPGAPTALTAQPSAGGITVSFATPTSNGGDAVTGYTITVTPLAGGATTIRNVAVGSSPYTESITGLTAGASYSVDVTAANTIGTGTASTVSLIIPGRPSAPREVTVEPRIGGAYVAWTAPAYDGSVALASYYVRAYATGTSTLVAATAVGAGTLATTLAGLVDGTAYDISVTAAHGAITAATDVPTDQGVESDTATLTAGRPLAPTEVAAAAGAGSITVTWNSVADVTGIVVTGYAITYTAGTSTTTTASCATATCSTTISSLTNGTTYSVVVTAQSTGGNGPASSPAVTATPRTTPGQPATLTATAADGAVEASWTTPSSTGGSPITGYEVTVSTGGTTIASYSLAADQTAITADSLTNGTSYTVSVAALNAAGSGSARTATTTPVGAPSVPLNVAATPNATTFTVSWSAPSSTGGTAITGYTVIITDSAGVVTESASTCVSATCSSTISTVDDGEGGTTSVAADTRYTVSVRATNAAGDGPAATDTVVVPGQPSAPTNVTITDGTGQFHICLLEPTSKPGGAVTAYGLSISEDGTDTGLLAVEVASWSSSTPCSGGAVGYTVSTLANGNPVQNGSTYAVEVSATSTAGVSSISAYSTDAVFGPNATGTATPYTTPAAPTAITAAAGSSQITMTISAGSTRGRTITNYEWSLDSTNGSDGTWTAFSPAQTNGTFLLTGLTNGTSYTPWLRAVNTAGSGTGTAGAATTPRTTPAAPGAVAATAGDASISLSVTPGANGGSAITNYEWSLNSTNGSDGTWTAFSPAQTDGTFLLTGLSNGTSYTPWLRAVNAAGAGAGTSATGVTPASTTPRGGGSGTGQTSGSTGSATAGAGATSGGSDSNLRTLTVKVKAKTKIARILSAAGLRAPKGAKVTMRSTGSRSAVAVSSRQVIAKKTGTYTLTITVKPKKGAVATARLILVATKSGRMLLR